MKSLHVRTVVWAAILGVFLLLPIGCGSSQLGETAAESRRRHKRVMRINYREMLTDIERVYLLDQPSKLTDKRMP